VSLEQTVFVAMCIMCALALAALLLFPEEEN
jgi:hypothetical protein